MLILNNAVKAGLRNIAAICLALACVLFFASSAVGQPTSLRDFTPSQRRAMTEDKLEKAANLTERIKKDSRNVALYRERLQFYQDLMELNFDNRDSLLYADKFEADLSRLVELEETADNYIWRGNWFSERLRRLPPTSKIAGLYPLNQYVDKAASDYLKAIQLISAPTNLISAYANLSELYTTRPQKLLPDADFQKWRAEIPFKLVLSDFDNAIKYRRKALEAGAGLSYADLLKANLAGTYKKNADTASRLGDYETALKLYQAGQNYLSDEYSQCQYYAAWGNVYLKLGKFDKAIEIFNIYRKTDDSRCADLFANRGFALTAKGEYEQAFADYNKALTLDEADSLQRTGWAYIGRARLFLKTGKPREALADLNTTIEKKYIAECPQVYKIRAEAYRRLGKSALAVSDEQTASKLRNQPNCPFD